ncbi:MULTISPECIES: DUF5719 family protein [Kitasatospora]|uniref:Secreted protein n=1 Tax=Kitasatospora setae (strain ATCC 33774 / DSM 43861 / JCM 3304 / KCC A-0304 / NBRC 14216 / KM-6054) TaxID=452652 RepID=E4NC20_KITSK|nr:MULTISPECIES: DUF5719 family protein [Kitasatospora]BAJ28751.1 hypothetical protein KSE_29390 [Kitasatospora setae KM-6054]
MKKPTLKAPKLKAPKLKAPDLSAVAGGSRTGQSLLAGVAVLGLVFGVAELRAPAGAAGAGGARTTAQVERTALVCPPPMQGVTGSTSITLFSPEGGTGATGTGLLADATTENVLAAQNPAQPAASASASAAAPAPAAPSGSPAAPAAAAVDARINLAKPGVPVTGPAANTDTAPGSFAMAAGNLAPGFTATQLTSSEQGGASLSGAGCLPSGTSFWFSGASTADGRVDYVTLVNADTLPAVVDLRMYGDKGPIENDLATGIAIAPGKFQTMALRSLTKGPVDNLALHVVTRSGRIGAGVHAVDTGKGTDWLEPSADPAPAVTVPGIPDDVTTAHLVVATDSADDADLKVQLSGKNGWFTPAGKETLHVKAGMTAVLDFQFTDQTREGASAIRLTPSSDTHPTPIVAGLRVDRENKGKTEAGWLSGGAPIGARATIADNRAGQTKLMLTATDGDAKVRVTSSAGASGGTPASKEVSVPAGSTVTVDGIDPAQANGPYALTLQTLAGGPVLATRQISAVTRDVPTFTVQRFRDDHATVEVPHVAADPGVVLK